MVFCAYSVLILRFFKRNKVFVEDCLQICKSLIAAFEVNATHSKLLGCSYTGQAIVKEKRFLGNNAQSLACEFIDTRIRLHDPFFGRVDHNIYLNGIR